MLFDAVQTYYKLSGAERKMEERLLQTGEYGEVQEMAQTVMERLEARAQRRGEALALRRVAKQAILKRFPQAPAEISDRVDRIQQAARLEELINRVIEARDLSEIEAWLAP